MAETAAFHYRAFLSYLDWQRDLFLTYSRLSGLLAAQAKRGEARAAMQKAEPICNKLAASARTNPGWQFQMALMNWRLSGLEDDGARRIPTVIAT